MGAGLDRSLVRSGSETPTAHVEYDGTGPRAFMGWLQVVVRHDDDGTSTPDVDAVALLGEASPLYTFGYKPMSSNGTLVAPETCGRN